jgi:hypothetical protein
MSVTMHLRTEGPQRRDGRLVSTALLDQPGHEPVSLWFSVPERWERALSPDCDHLVIGALPLAMSRGADLAVHGRAGPTLLRNLEEFMAAMSRWQPDVLRQVAISADEEREAEPPAADAGAVLAYSGGVDSTFTLLHHLKGGAGRRTRRIAAAMMIHGREIRLADGEAFEATARKSEEFLAPLGVELIRAATNFTEVVRFWRFWQGAVLAASMSMLKGGFSAGLVSASWSYGQLRMPQGSDPITDPLLSGRHFRILHEGAGFTRVEKIRELARWPEACRQLKVCLADAVGAENCGRCYKCVRTIIAFRAIGVERPAAFPTLPTDGEIAGLRVRPWEVDQMAEAVEFARGAGFGRASWCRALERCVISNRRRLRHRALKHWFQGWNPLYPLWRRLRHGRAVGGTPVR